jgi:xanthine dehydrogenase YagT iron-sulfur-binding subunit
VNISRLRDPEGCDHGNVAPAVLLDEHRINSCLTLAVMHDGQAITRRGADGESATSLQAAFVATMAFSVGIAPLGSLFSGRNARRKSGGHADYVTGT